MNLDYALEVAVKRGMLQHQQEIADFARFIIGRPLDTVIEIGMLKGGTTELWLQLASKRVIGIDLPNGPFGGAAHNLDVKTCEARNQSLNMTYGSNFYGVLGDSHAADTWKQVITVLCGQRADVLFIDGDHRYEAVLADYELYKQLVKPGGVVAFHGVNDTDFHATAGVEVPCLWSELIGEKQVFTVGAEWGGIGAIIL